jgi:hypothetical protein
MTTIAILPWRPRRGRPIPNTHRPKAPGENVTVNPVPIAHEIAWQHVQLSKFLPSYCSCGFALRFAIEFVSRFVAASRVTAHHLGGF